MSGLEVRALGPETWEPYAAMIERHNGVWGGCWCIGFHTRDFGTPEQNRARKAAMVAAGETRAALVFDGADCVGWAQWGRPAERPAIKGRGAYEAGVAGDGAPPDWRITCFFVDKTRRRDGIAQVALEGALAQIAAAGSGVAEGFPEALEGQKTSAGFLYCGTLGLFERAGFTPVRRIGKHRWLVRREVEAA